MKKSLITISIICSSGFSSDLGVMKLPPATTVEKTFTPSNPHPNDDDDDDYALQQNSGRGRSEFSSQEISGKTSTVGVSPPLSSMRYSDGTSSDGDGDDEQRLLQAAELREKKISLGLDPSIEGPITLEELRSSRTLTAKGQAYKKTLELQEILEKLKNKKAELGKEIHERSMIEAWRVGVGDGSIDWKKLPPDLQDLIAEAYEL